jgi:Coenzyme PQQ synthesis protein D (PqqD)
MSEVRAGEVKINSTKVASRKDGEVYTLFHVPSDNFVVLDKLGQRVWEKMENGITDISTLITEHSNELQIPSEVAAYQIISFLDELRAQGFVDLDITQERSAAPLLDAPLSDLSPRVLKQVLAKWFEAHGPEKRGAILVDAPRANLSLRDVKQIAERISDTDISVIQRAIVLDTARTDLSLEDVKKIVEHPLEANIPDTRRVAILESPRSSLLLRELVISVLPPVPPAPAPTMRGVIVIIIITDSLAIVATINGDGPGATPRGKSRSACKTMCV